MTEPEKFRFVAEEETRAFREYMVDEAEQQFRDYYESDDEEQSFFEYLGNLSNRDKIRFMEIFEDYTVDKTDYKDFAMIPKREYNPELSVLSNMVLDLVDFKDRVRPLSKDVSMLEQAKRYQKQSAHSVLESKAKFNELTEEIQGGSFGKERLTEAAQPKEEQGYSSIEAPEEKVEEPVVEENVEEGAEEAKKEE